MATQKRKSSHLCRIALVAAMVVLIAELVAAQTPINDAQQQWQQLNAQVIEAYQAGDYAKGVASAEQALQLARQAFGPRHPDTLTSLNNLAALYRAQGRYGEAEPLYKEALQGRRESLGPRHPDTLGSLNNLALLYRAQGRYGEAEPLYKEALQGSRESLGPRHPDTLQSLNNLAALYHAQGRYGEAEPLYKEALQGAPREPRPAPSKHADQPQQPGRSLRRAGPLRRGGAALQGGAARKPRVDLLRKSGELLLNEEDFHAQAAETFYAGLSR